MFHAISSMFLMIVDLKKMLASILRKNEAAFLDLNTNKLHEGGKRRYYAANIANFE